MTAFLCAFFMLSCIQAQNIKSSEVPEDVIQQFSFIYPDAQRVSWKLKKEKYQADFKNDKKATKAIFQPDGSLFLTKTEIKVCALPPSAVGFLTKDEPDVKIDIACIIEDHQGVITFEAIVDKTEFLFDNTGQYLVSNAVALNSED